MTLIERLRNLREQRREYGHGLNFAVEGDDVDVALDEAAAELEANAAEIERKDAALKEAKELIQREREIVFDSYKQLSGKYKGQVIDREAKREIAEFDAVLATIAAALNKQESGNV